MKARSIVEIQLKQGRIISIGTDVDIIIPLRYPEIAFIRTTSKNKHVNFKLKTENLRDYFNFY